MLTFLTGTYFTAKKQYIYESIRALLEKGERVCLIVPEQSSFDRDRDFLFTYGEKLGNKLTVSSFTHLSRDVLEQNGFRVKPEADEAARNVTMSIAAQECCDELDIYAGFASRTNSVARLLGEYSEIKSAGLDVSSLYEVSERLPEGTLRNKTKELARIFSVYEAILSERFSDASDNIAVMGEFLKSNPVFAGQYMFFDDFRGFTGAQIKLLREIISQAKETYVSVFAPDSVSAGDSGAFAHAVLNCRRLRAVAGESGVGCEEIKISSTHPVKALDALNSSLFCGEKEAFSEKTEAVTLICAENKYAECDFIALEIKKLLESGMRCRDISITERSGKYMNAMTSALKKYGIPVFEDKRVPLSEYPLIRMILSAVAVCVHGFSSEEVFSYVKTGLCGIDDEECALLENYAFIWQTEKSGWTKPFTSHPDGFGEEDTEQSRRQLERLEALRQRLVTPLQTLKRKLEKGEADTSCTAIYELLVSVNAAENFRNYAVALAENGNEAAATECARVWDFAMQSLDALYEAVSSRQLSPQRFYELLRIILSSGDVGRIPAGVDEIVIGTAGRTRHLEPKAVFVAGCNEGVFPQTPQNTGLFTSAEKRILGSNSFALESIPENIYAEERMIAYSVLNNATERLYVSYSTSDSSGGVLAPSEIITGIKEILPCVRCINTAQLSSMEKIGSLESAFEQCTVHFSENTPYSSSLRAFIEEGSLAHRLEAVRRLTENEPAKISDSDISTELFGKDMYISPSRADVFYTCAFRYFCQYGLNIKKARVADLDARINGLLIHYLLENILLSHSNKELCDMAEDELRAEVERITEEFISQFMGGRDDKGILLNRSLDKTKDTAFAILSRMRLEFSESLFETVAVELSISRDGKIAPCEIKLSDGGSITVGGKVDRVDAMKDSEQTYIRVVDYKTGGKEFRLSDVFDGLNMQMLIYLMCIWDSGEKEFGKVIPAGILYVPANTSGNYLPRNAGASEIEEQKLKNGKMNGMILEDLKVLEGMEKGCKGRFINASINDKGEMKGTFLSLKGFRLLHEKIDSMLEGMGISLHKGEIAALPMIEDESKSPCRYCDYKDVCRRSEGDPSRAPTKYTHDKSRAMLEGCEENG